ncbi:MAG: hypothetical protein WCY19_03110 [Candidatus Gastranaerophilaceae bacterium]
MKKIFLLAVLSFSIFSPAFAEKIPVKIAPAQAFSTHHDEVQIGDWINFETVNDVYNGDKLYIKKGTRVIGVVDFVHDNGWLADSAEITLKEFLTVDANNKKVEIPYTIKIKGNEFVENEKRQCLTYIAYAFQSLAFFLRGPEIYIEPDKKVFNIFIER